MVYLSVTVVCEGVGKLWEIVECHLETITIRELFRTLQLPRLGLFEFADNPEKPQ